MVCQSCGTEAPTKYIEFYSNIGVLIVRFEQFVKGNLCKSCIRENFWKHILINLLLGWWGIISFFATIFFMISNFISYVGTRKLEAAPSGQLGAHTIRLRWVIAGRLALIFFILWLVCVIGAVLAHAPTPVQSAAEVQATAQALADVTAPTQIEAKMGEFARAANRVYGPVSNTLTGQQDKKLELSSSVLRQHNFIAQARFYNPDISAEFGWSYGLLFRSTRDGQYRLYVTSEGYWFLDLVTGPDNNPIFKEIANSKAPGLDLSKSGWNQLGVVVSGIDALFFINGTYVDTLDVSMQTDAGEIKAGIDFILDYEMDGRPTRYQDFTVWELP
jgi:hypothetical protein